MVGNNVIIQYGVEDIYGTIGNATKQIQISKESFKLDLNKKDEGLLTGKKVGGRLHTMSRKNSGGIDTLARPDDIGLFLAAMLGSETTTLVDGATGAYEHVYKISDSQFLDSLFFKVKRDDSIVKGYTGLTIDGMSLNTQAEDYLNLNLTMMGKDEVDTTLQSGLSLSPLAPFRFASCVIKFDTTELETESVKFDYKNGCSQIQTNKSGIYMRQPEPGVREITIEPSVIYDSSVEALRLSKWLQDNTLSVELKFYSGQEVETGIPYSLSILLPTCQLTDATTNVDNADLLKMNLPLRAVSGDGDEIVVTLVNGFATNYIS